MVRITTDTDHELAGEDTGSALPGPLKRWTRYRFADASIPERAQLRVLASPPLPHELPALNAMDPGLEALNVAMERVLTRTPIAPVDYAKDHATRWLLVSPFEVFLEHVVAKKLGELE